MPAGLEEDLGIFASAPARAVAPVADDDFGMFNAAPLKERLAPATAVAAKVPDEPEDYGIFSSAPKLPQRAVVQSTEAVVAQSPEPVKRDAGVGESLWRGFNQMGAQLGEWGLLALGAGNPVVLGDAVAKELGVPFAGKVADWWMKNAVEPQRKAAEAYQINPDTEQQSTAAQIASTVGPLVRDIGLTMATVGASEVPVIATQTANVFKSLMPSIRQGIIGMTAPASIAATDAQNAARKAGKSETDAVIDGVMAQAKLTAMGAIPLATASGANSAVQRFVERTAKALPMVAGQNEAMHAAEALARGEQYQFDPERMLVESLPMAIIAGTSGRRDSETSTASRQSEAVPADPLAPDSPSNPEPIQGQRPVAESPESTLPPVDERIQSPAQHDQQTNSQPQPQPNDPASTPQGETARTLTVDEAPSIEPKAPLPSEAQTGVEWTGELMRGRTPSRQKTDAGDYGRGEYWTGDGNLAAAYAKPVIGTEGEVGNVVLQKVTLKNPLVFKTRAEARAYRKSLVGEKLLDQPQSEEAANIIDADLRAKGHDGVVVYDTEGTATAFDQRPFEVSVLKDAAPPESGLPAGFTSVGASTGADIPAGKVTGTKNAVTDQERITRGLQPIMREARQSNPETFEMAESRLAENADLGRQIAKDLAEGRKREVSEVDEAILLHEKITVQNEREAAAIRALDESLPAEERAQWKQRYADMEARANEIDQATHRAGTVWGRLGQFRQRLMADDYTFAAMERKARIAKGGPLTPEETTLIKKTSEQLESTQRQAGEKIAKAEEDAAGAAAEAEIRKIKVRADNDARKERKTGTERDLDGERASILDGIRARVEQGDKPADLRSWVQKLAENIVRKEPKIEREAMMDRLHGEVSKVAPDLTRRQTMDILSGYGDSRLPSQEAAKVRLRQIKSELQSLAKIQDMESGQPPKRSGPQRDNPTDEKRRLEKIANELKKKGGFVVTDPAKQLKSALDAIKTRLNHQIADLEHQIATRARIVKTRTATPRDAEATALEQRRDELKQQFTEIFGKKELTDAERLRIATKAVERSIADYEARLKTGNFDQKSRRAAPETPELTALRAQRDLLRTEYKALESAAHPERALETQLRVYKAMLKRQTAELEGRIERGDFAPKPPKVKPELDSEALNLKRENAKAKEQFTRKLFEWQMANRSWQKKAVDTGRESIAVSRAMLTSADVSAVLRQGAFIGFGHPVRAMKNIPVMLKAFASEKVQFDTMQEILSRDNARYYEQGKLFLADNAAIDLSRMEEMYMTRLLDKIPRWLGGGVVRGSARAYTTFLNKLRADSFDAMAKTLSIDGGPPTPAQIRDIARFINEATGRAEAEGKAGQWMVGLNSVLFAPRFAVSRFQMLALHPILKAGDAQSRKLIAMEYGRFLVGIGTTYALAQAAGWEVEFDPRSSDFGKIKIGNTRLDPLGGLAQASVFVSRVATGEFKSANSGEVRGLRPDLRPLNLIRDEPMNDEPRYGQSDTSGVMWNFLRSKLSPQLGTFIDVSTGKNMVGEKVTPTDAAVGMVIPLSFRDVLVTMEEQGVPAGTAMFLVSLLGAGMQTHTPKEDDEDEVKEAPPVLIGYPRR